MVYSTCFKFQPYAAIIAECASNKIPVWYMMPKRSLQSSSLDKNIKLNKRLMDKTNFVKLTKTNYSNLQSVSEMQTMNSTDGEEKVRQVKVEYLDTPVKSKSDKKDYRVIRLENGLTALLISDVHSIKDTESQDTNEKEACASATDDESEDSEEESADDSEDDSQEENDNDENEEGENVGIKQTKREEKMAACGLCVGVGSFSDPIEIQGLAHFLEHMVFMGSKKYPQENDFDNFIKKRGGSDNACTDCEQTTFYFEIQEKHLLPAMERFAQFFISPLMKRDAITREREAVESEFKMALPSDSNRKEQLFCSLARQNHPATKFPWGNLVTLRDNVDEDDLYSKLHQFRERHYSAHRMTLAVQARLPLSDLEQYVKDCFSDVPVNHLPADDFTEFKGKNSFDNPEFRKIYKIKPNKDICQVELTWVMAPLHHLYKSKPHQYVSWIIGHEGKGSLISYLRKKMWCIDISSGNGEGGFEHSSMYALFSLALTLTDEGYKHLKEVLEAVFSYINMLRREGIQKRIFDEIQQIEKINFRFTDEDDPVDYVEALCENMHFYPPVDYITGSDLYFEYDPESIQNCIDALSPENVNIIIADKKFDEKDFDKVEPWFQTKYSCSNIPEEWTTYWEKIDPLPEFHLPQPNMYITDDFSLISLPDNVPDFPVKIHEDDRTEIWYRADPKFRLPECHINLHLITPSAIESPQSAALLNIFVAVLKQVSVEDLYDATAAELNYSIVLSVKGIAVRVYGFNQKLPLLLNSIVGYIANCYKLVTEELFNVMKREISKHFYNTFLKPAKLVKEVRLSILSTGLWTATEKHAAVSDVTFQQFKSFAEHLTDKLYIQCLAQGNLTQDHALKSIIECLEPLKSGTLQRDERPNIKVFEMPLGEKCCRVANFNPTDCNSVVTNYYQSDLASIQLYSIIELLMLIMEEPLFNQLRTQEQLGYNVFCLVRDTHGVLGYSITVCTQANKFKTEYIDERIENFVKFLIDHLEKMPDDEYNFTRESLVKSKECTDIHLKEEVDRNWCEIIREEYIFDRYIKEISAINEISIDKLKKWLNEHSVNGKSFRKITVQAVGTADLDNECKQDKQNIDPGTIKYSLNFLTDESDKRTSDYYITNIEDFKKTLKEYPTSQKYL